MITAERERELVARSQAGDRFATGELLSAHSGMLKKLANRNSGDFDDNMQEASIALIKAIAGFDASKGFRLLTYAGFKISNQFQLARNAQQLIRTPIHNNWRTLSAELREATDRAKRPRSLDAPILDGASTFGAKVADDYDFTDDIDTREESQRLAWAISMLPFRSEKIVRLRMDGGTLEDAGALVGVSKEWIRQIEPKIHLSLKHLIECKPVRPRPAFILRTGNVKPVVCETTGTVYKSVSECAAALGVNAAMVCRHIRHYGGALNGRVVRYALPSEAGQPVVRMRIDPRARGVIHVGSGDYFHSLTTAARRFNLNQPALWKSMNCGRKRGHYRGHQFIYATDAAGGAA